MTPDLSLERATGLARVAGVDEAGRGPWAGPVTAAAVVLDTDNIPAGIDDSKKLGPDRREALFENITRSCEHGIGWASVEEIDELNILVATHLAMRRALDALRKPPDMALIDGNRTPPDLPCPAQAIVKGDARSLSIAAASIIAKVSRDRVMRDLARLFKGYGWETNMGYGTRAHQLSLLRNGVTPHHRRSFKPVYKILCQE